MSLRLFRAVVSLKILKKSSGRKERRRKERSEVGRKETKEEEERKTKSFSTAQQTPSTVSTDGL